MAKDSVKQGELLTKTRTNTITKEIKEIKKIRQNLTPQIKEHKIKRDELTLEQKTKRVQKEVKKYERKVLGGVYKNSFVYGDDIEDVFGFSARILDINSISYIIQKKIEKDFTTMASDKKFKCTLRSYVTIKTLMFRIVEGEDGAEEEERDFYFNSTPFDVVSMNNISSIVNNLVEQYMTSLTQATGSSNWVFRRILKLTLSSTVIKSALGKSYIELPKVIQNKKATINIKNDDDKCFDYALIASKLYKKQDKSDKNLKN